MQSTSYTYDKRNRLSGATLPAGASLVVTNNEADQRTNLAYPNGTNLATTYLADGSADVITLTGPGGPVLERWDYAYDAVSNVDTITTTQGVYDYGYDGLDRLTSGTYPAATGLATENYLYDPVGNRELPFDANAYIYDANNRMTKSAGYSLNGYDADGSLTDRVGGGGLTVGAQYDVTNRPTAWATDTLSLSTYLDYAHEPQGRRVRVHAETVTGTITKETTAYYLWAGDRIVAEYDGNGARTVRYAYLPGDYAPIQQATVTATTYLHSDRLQTPRRGTSTAGVVTWKGDYRSFGDGAPNTDPDGNGQVVVVKHRFPGQYADESGLSYNFFRDYEPATGRYVEADPIGLGGGPNLFTYANLNPTTYSDPRGLQVFVPFPRPRPEMPFPVPTPFEPPPRPDDDGDSRRRDYAACYATCMFSFTLKASLCNTIFDCDIEAKIACLIQAGEERDNCISICRRQYGY